LCLRSEEITEERVWRLWAAYWIEKTGESPRLTQVRAVSPASVNEQRSLKVSPAIAASVPDWLYELGATELGEKWPSVLKELNHAAPVDLRTNTLRITRDELRERLTQEGIETDAVAGLPDALRLRERKNVFITQAFKDGLFEMQDAASQRIAPFAQVTPGQRVVDACAGAGGKTLHLAALMQNKGRIIAMDIHQWKLDELRKRARRGGVGNFEARLIEDSRTIKRLARSADRVLLDVPCSGLGALRRNPDSKWKLTPAEIERLRALQAELLRSHSRMVKPGGKLTYATCSILPTENEQQVRSFLKEFGDEWTLEEELRLLPGKNDGDGFYAARMTRSENVGDASTLRSRDDVP
jgi:16S rRNA (cytosine967-C5)-methyltransferase